MGGDAIAGADWPRSPEHSPGLSPVQLQGYCPDSAWILPSLHYRAVCSMGIHLSFGTTPSLSRFSLYPQNQKAVGLILPGFLEYYFSTEAGELRTTNRAGGLRKWLFLFYCQTLYASGLLPLLPLCVFSLLSFPLFRFLFLFFDFIFFFLSLILSYNVQCLFNKRKDPCELFFCTHD